jgi:PhnB protein
MSKHDHVRHGFGHVRPYLQGPLELPEFLVDVFGAVELERLAFAEDGFHVELRIGDGVVVVEAGELPAGVEPWNGSVYVYVEDVDSVYQRALECGAETIEAPEDKPFQERMAGFRDEGGNTWWVGSYRGAGPR